MRRVKAFRLRGIEALAGCAWRRRARRASGRPWRSRTHRAVAVPRPGGSPALAVASRCPSPS